MDCQAGDGGTKKGDAGDGGDAAPTDSGGGDAPADAPPG
jgi:hypothetical protein